MRLGSVGRIVRIRLSSVARSRNLHRQAEDLTHLENLRKWLAQQPTYVESQTFFRLLHICGRLKALTEGRKLHALIREKGLHSDIFMANCILNMYGKCHSVQDARGVFDQIIDANAVSWTSMIAIYAKHGLARDALDVFQKMQLVPICPNEVTFITALNACKHAKFIVECNLIYFLIVHHGYDCQVSVANALVSAYAKCGSVIHAHEVFLKMTDRNIVSWTTMIKAFAELDYSKALETFMQMLIEGMETNNVTQLTVLNVCSASNLLMEAKRIHVVIMETGGFLDVILGSALVIMYGKCGTAEDACRVFNALPQRNVITWNGMISVFAHNGFRIQAFEHFEMMQQEGIEPNRISFTTVLSLCASSDDIIEGRIVHACGVQLGLDSSDVVGCALVDMYGKCGSLRDAHRHFNQLEKQDVLSWTCVIGSYAKVGDMQDTLVLFHQMQVEGVLPNEVMFASVLSAFGNSEVLAHGKMLHLHIQEVLLEVHDVVGSSLVSMYGRCGDLMTAWKVFENTRQRSVVMWNALIGANGQQGHGLKSLEFLNLMLMEGVEPNSISFSSIFLICADLGLCGQGERIYNYAIECEIETDVAVGSAIINMYGKYGRLEDALWMFHRAHKRNLISWNNIMAAHALHGSLQDVLGLFEQMKLDQVRPNEVTFTVMLEACSNFEALEEGKILHNLIIQRGLEAIPAIGNALISTYGNCRVLREAQSVFNGLPKRNLISWNTMIGMHASYSHFKEVFQLFQLVQQEAIELDKVSLVHALSACANLAALAEGEIVYACAISKGVHLDVAIQSALVSIFSKCGRVKDAQNVFDRMHEHDVISCTAIIVAYAQHGHATEALRYFQFMQEEGIKPNEISFVSILSACSHAGLADAGCIFFVSMIQDFGMTPTASQFSCLIDIFGRSGQLDRAENLIGRIPVQPATAMWMTLIGACTTNGDVERGNRISSCMLQLDSSLLSGMCAMDGFP